MMAACVRFALTVVMSMAVVSATRAGTVDPSWTLDEATVTAIEATLTLPSRRPWKPGPLESYARYYKIMMMNGIKVIYGDLLRGRLAQDRPGIYLRSPSGIILGGGCDQIQLWYDIVARRMIQIQCYGLG